jgi:hypothetical protein
LLPLSTPPSDEAPPLLPEEPPAAPSTPSPPAALESLLPQDCTSSARATTGAIAAVFVRLMFAARPEDRIQRVRPPPIRRLRWVVGALVCVVLPAGSWLEGSRAFAWSMYSRAGEFRIDVVTFDAAGRAHARNPSALAEHATPAAADLLAGSDHWRPGPSVAVLRTHIADLAGYACRELGATAVEITLRERAASGKERVTTQRSECTP